MRRSLKASLMTSTAVLLSTSAWAADPYFAAYIPGNSQWNVSMLYDYMPVKHTPIGDIPVVMPTVGVDITAEQYNTELNHLLNIAGPTPASHVPPHNYDNGYSGWGMTTIDPRSNVLFTAQTLDTFTQWAAVPGVAPTIPNSDFKPFIGGTLTENSSMYLEPGPYAPVIDGISLADLADHRIRVSSIDDKIDAVYTPPDGLTLKQAEQVCAQEVGAVGCRFNWKQTITGMPDGPSPFYLWNNGNPKPFTSADVPISDPPAGGGWTYEHDELTGETDNSFPFYYDYNVDLLEHEKQNSLTYSDTPADPCLSGGLGAGTDYCNGGTATGSMHFETKLVGMLTDANGQYNGHYVDFHTGVTWESDSNRSVKDVIRNGGTRTGGPFNIETFKSDPGNVYSDGTGSVTIDQVFNGDPNIVTADVMVSVPEPRTWIMVIIGFFGLGFVNSRRRYY